jgi:copper resistance protein B
MRRLASAAALLIASTSSPVMAQMDHSTHQVHGAPKADDGIAQGVAPAVPTDHAADAVYDPSEMARARAAMLKESGGMSFSQLMLDRLEYRMGKGGDSYHWEGEGWIGGDIHRFAFKTEGEGDVGGRLESAEVQALYSRAIDPWFNLEAGVRQDFRPSPQRSYAVIGVEGWRLTGSRWARRPFCRTRATRICGWRAVMTSASPNA